MYYPLFSVVFFIDLTVVIIANKNDTVNKKVIILDILLNYTKTEVNILDTLSIIKALLAKNNLTQKALTDYLGISKNAFTNWSNGSNMSYIKHLPQIAEFFNVSIDYLAGKSEIKTDFTYAAYDELTHDLTPVQLEQLKTYAEFLRSQK